MQIKSYKIVQQIRDIFLRW